MRLWLIGLCLLTAGCVTTGSFEYYERCAQQRQDDRYRWTRLLKEDKISQSDYNDLIRAQGDLIKIQETSREKP